MGLLRVIILMMLAINLMAVERIGGGEIKNFNMRYDNYGGYITADRFKLLTDELVIDSQNFFGKLILFQWEKLILQNQQTGEEYLFSDKNTMEFFNDLSSAEVRFSLLFNDEQELKIENLSMIVDRFDQSFFMIDTLVGGCYQKGKGKELVERGNEELLEGILLSCLEEGNLAVNELQFNSSPNWRGEELLRRIFETLRTAQTVEIVRHDLARNVEKMKELSLNIKKGKAYFTAISRVRLQIEAMITFNESSNLLVIQILKAKAGIFNIKEKLLNDVATAALSNITVEGDCIIIMVEQG
ncbi:MAG: hypothetical protein A2504_09135 [Bdellovibrionales bacterium RIFOXYD12_FULL_39_22]|nr:MAG: hypothetical protein A2385_17415 [Bdellovibrionales bacterium RIFOXYB1_FULL_39_21]OFZ41095.1 MAG: hypothetical protein A2485_00340 [Bdellovibrionales bacterium RIFOXYC12_FULL_39_17]OFZ50308.1 MAG: hypothetical protein A2404_07655 [Bdellovibrionales bacterium RIFOXYC1_FULL_39_130]OFZ72055.1 MAG: hypothetical protein A2451_05560 [Bdellovibrionales bacterium RIFOXYC2_FULL_39_8]OFZ75109.1 MAG: hypothetical protein A2560_16350 [Bdellovibrionales bacterium RIFOXYD1_FULL_39_84]OFZ92249.1 MAG: